jgi:hypothetical protein
LATCEEKSGNEAELPSGCYEKKNVAIAILVLKVLRFCLYLLKVKGGMKNYLKKPKVVLSSFCFFQPYQF